MAQIVKVTGTGKVLLSDVSDSRIGRLSVTIPAGTTISTTFVGRPNHSALVAADDVTLSYYTPASDALAAVAVTAGQVHVKADGNLVYANVASGTFPLTLVVVPLLGA